MYQNVKYPMATAAELRSLDGFFASNPSSEVASRTDYIAKFGYGRYSAEEIDTLVDFIGHSKALDLGAGLGYLTRILRDHGVDVRGLDSRKGADTQAVWRTDPTKMYTEIENREINTMDGFLEKVIIMSWPDLSNDTAVQILNKLRPGQILLVLTAESETNSLARPFFTKLDSGRFERLAIQDTLNAHHVSLRLGGDRWVAVKAVG